MRCIKLQKPPRVHSPISNWRQRASRKSETGENSHTSKRPVAASITKAPQHGITYTCTKRCEDKGLETGLTHDCGARGCCKAAGVGAGTLAWFQAARLCICICICIWICACAQGGACAAGAHIGGDICVSVRAMVTAGPWCCRRCVCESVRVVASCVLLFPAA